MRTLLRSPGSMSATTAQSTGSPGTLYSGSAICAISFDLYGTLLRYEDLDRSWQEWQSALYAHLIQEGVEIDAKEFPQVCRRFFDGNVLPQGGLSVFEYRISRLAERFGVSVAAETLTRIADDCCQKWQQSITLDPECIEILTMLRQRFKLFLASNFDHPSHVRKLLVDQGLADFFEAILISGEQGVKKPDAALFARLWEQQSLDPSRCAHVGDSVEDYYFAIGTGMVPILLSREQRVNGRIDFMENELHTVSNVHHIQRLRGLIEVLSALG